MIKLFNKYDITGYTIIEDIKGSGGHGLKTADDVSNILSNNYIFIVCQEQTYLNMKDSIVDFIKKYGGKCIVSDVTLLI